MSDGTIHVEKDAYNKSRHKHDWRKNRYFRKNRRDDAYFTVDGVKPKVKIDETESAAGPFYVFLGDIAEKGTGKLFVSKANNPQLKMYEKYL